MSIFKRFPTRAGLDRDVEHMRGAATIHFWALALLLLAACGSQEPPEPTRLPVCISQDIYAYNPCVNDSCSPGAGEILADMDPTFSWRYTEAGRCHPKSFFFRIKEYDPIDGLWNVLFEELITELEEPDGRLVSSYSMENGLEPGKAYSWKVLAETKSGNIIPLLVPAVEFFTGPICAANELVGPTLIAPADNAILNSGFPRLRIDYPRPCVPESYLYQLSANQDFLGPDILAAHLDLPIAKYLITSKIEDCRQYYWRALAFSGDMEGPYSETFTFSTDFTGICP